MLSSLQVEDGVAKPTGQLKNQIKELKMAFHLSAQDVRIDDKHYLRALLSNESGDLVEAEFDLDTVLGNDEGSFSWDGANFSESAEDVTFSIEGDGQVPVLRALLYNSAGETFPRDVNLAERIENHDGAFVYV
ncbi:hypothetical protein MAP00_000892 [Monascus purpureus]|nr:hypothetical protein MAP00_000892 [Monascus purpureus]